MAPPVTPTRPRGRCLAARTGCTEGKGWPGGGGWRYLPSLSRLEPPRRDARAAVLHTRASSAGSRQRLLSGNFPVLMLERSPFGAKNGVRAEKGPWVGRVSPHPRSRPPATYTRRPSGKRGAACAAPHGAPLGGLKCYIQNVLSSGEQWCLRERKGSRELRLRTSGVQYERHRSRPKKHHLRVITVAQGKDKRYA